MNRFFRSIIILLFPVAAFSQKEYFIYLQSETDQPFFVRLADKTYNSSPAGYLILSKLKDTSHTFKVGFPQNKWPDQQFTVAVRSKDHGYLLKNFGEKGWGLFDLQTMAVQMSSGMAATKPSTNGTAEVSAFTEILSKAANDPTLKEKPVFAVVREPKPVNSNQEPIAVNEKPKENNPGMVDTPSKKADLVAAGDAKKEVQEAVYKKAPNKLSTEPTGSIANVADTPIKKEDLIAKEETKKEAEPVTPQRIPDSTETKPGVNIAVVTDSLVNRESPIVKEQVKKESEPVVTAKATDSARTQPADNAIAGSEPVEKESSLINEETKKESSVIVSNTEPVSRTKENAPASPDYERSEVIKKSESSTTEGFGLIFIDKIADWKQDTIQIIIPNPKSTLEDAGKVRTDDKKFLDISDEDVKPAVKKDIANNTCLSLASENDFFKLRKKMAGQKEDESMINEAKKDFKTKCFSVEQIRNLGNLFLNEAGKFLFYEAAYPNCSDKSGFTVLQAEFKDPYFVHRFKNLVN